jgi:hypothetical protein
MVLNGSNVVIYLAGSYISFAPGAVGFVLPGAVAEISVVQSRPEIGLDNNQACGGQAAAIGGKIKITAARLKVLEAKISCGLPANYFCKHN